MAYTVEEYLNLKKVEILYLRLEALEPFIPIYQRERSLICRVMKGHGKEELEKIERELSDLKQEAINIVTAIKMLQAGYCE